MAASFPTGIKSFTTKVDGAGNLIAADHVNALQEEVVALETEALKAWTPVTHNAANFTGSGAMTWGVDLADQVTLAYIKDGRKMTIAFRIVGSDVGGVASTDLRILIPGGFVAARLIGNACQVSDAGTLQAGLAYVEASGVLINLRKITDAVWTITAGDNSGATGEITIETTT